ncbi:MAG: aspartate aminotransferase [Chloroflexi bacterium]|nr:MAG: aspartate aminotransferase [Chloroflexota bacterium]
MKLRLPGPTEVPEHIALSGSKAMINHRGPEMAELVSSISSDLQTCFETKNEVHILTASGTGGLEAAIVNHISASDEVLVITIGIFGNRFLQLVEMTGAKPTVLKYDFGHAANANDVEKVLKDNSHIKFVVMTHNETSTGTTNNQIADIASIAKSFGCLVIVDAVSSLTAMSVEVDKWGLDVVVSGSQKGWMMAPGLAFISISEEAWDIQKKCTTPRFYFDLLKHKASLANGQTPWTPAVSLFYQLETALKDIKKEGMNNIFARHAFCAEKTRSSIKEMGFDLLADEGYESNSVTAIKAPDDLNVAQLLKVARTKYNTIFAGGQGSLGGKIFRFGHLGYVNENDIDMGLDALKSSLNEIGFRK